MPRVHQQSDNAIISLAQYLTRLTVQQDLWVEVGQALIHRLGIDLVAIGSKASDTDSASLSHRFQSARPALAGAMSAAAWTGVAQKTTAEVLETGFLASDWVAQPSPLAVVGLPVQIHNQTQYALVLGLYREAALSRTHLDRLLAVAGLISTTAERLDSEHELRRYRLHLESLVDERTQALTESNLRLAREAERREQAEARVRAERDKLTRILDAMQDAIYSVNDRYELEYTNPAFDLAFPDQGERRCYELIQGRHDACPWCQASLVFAGGSGRAEFRCARNGKTYDLLETPITNDDGRLSILCILRDISTRKHFEEAVKALAYHDPLTELPNRRLFQDRLTQAIALADRNGSKVALLMLDLDRFKPINDQLGHAVGDQLLQAVAQRLNRCVRAHDTVARIGGDEFILVLPELRAERGAFRVAEAILEQFQQPFQIAEQALTITASLGLSLYPDSAVDEKTLIAQADAAMYRSKEAGRNQYRAFQDAGLDRNGV
jgi:diguanylate cyclase (GGDEF)-like protein